MTTFTGRAGMTSAEFIAAREALGLTRAQFAIALGASYRALCHWEEGDRPIPKPVAKLINIILTFPDVRFCIVASARMSDQAGDVDGPV